MQVVQKKEKLLIMTGSTQRYVVFENRINRQTQSVQTGAKLLKNGQISC